MALCCVVKDTAAQIGNLYGKVRVKTSINHLWGKMKTSIIKTDIHSPKKKSKRKTLVPVNVLPSLEKSKYKNWFM